MSKRTQYEQPVELKEAEPRFVYWQRNWRINTERAHRPGAATRLHQAEAAHAGSYSDRQARISRQRGAEVRIWEAWGDPPDRLASGSGVEAPPMQSGLASVKKAFIAAPFWWAIESSKSLKVYRNPCRSPYCEPGLDPRGGCHS